MEKLNIKSKWIFFFQSLTINLIWLTFLFYFVGSFYSMRSLSLIASSHGSLQNFVLSIILWGAISLIGLIILSYIWAQLTYKSWKYEFTNNSFRIERGVIWKKYVSIPYGRIQNVDIYRGILTRILGLSTLKIQTAGLGGSYRNAFGGAEGILPGLDRKKAEELRNELIRRAQEAKQGL